MQSERKPYAIVAGLDHINGLQTVRILARHRIPVIGVTKNPNHYCSRTRLCERILVADTSSEEMIKSLVQIGPTLGSKAVIYPCTDIIVSIISKYREHLEPWYHIILPENKTVNMLMDKTQFYDFAEKNDFPVSRTLFIHNKTEAKKVAREFNFPCIVKPPMNSIPSWEQNSKSKAYLFDTPDEFLNSYDLLSLWSPTLIAQEWIVGPVNNLFSCNCYFSKNGEPLATFVARKLRQWPPETGDSCLGEECRNEEVLHETIRLFKSVNYRGLGYVEFKQDSRTGKNYIVEPNIGRPTGRSAIAETGGVEIIYSMYCDALDLPLPPNRVQKYGNAKWIYFARDLQSAFHYYRNGKLTLSEWLHSLRGVTVDAIFAWNDPMPFIAGLIRFVGDFSSPDKRQ